MHTDPQILAYHNTDYRVNGFRHPIRIGELSPEADELLREHDFTEWAFITAWNPMSEPLGDAENRLRNAELKSQLSAWVVSDENWPPEESFLVAGIPFESAVALARVYAQRAFVYGRAGEPARLWVEGQ
ncbi:MAG: DUF3293 domain-containing protein [Saprospiraceae bacterium]|nr:DUF3293 domain-containing protein [Saprospiraceae bacterium]